MVDSAMEKKISLEESFLIDVCWGEADPARCNKLNLQSLIKVSHQHKILPTLLTFFAENSIQFELDVETRKIYDDYINDRNFWVSVLKILNQHSTVLSSDFFILKGFSYEGLYPSGTMRYSVDMDVLLESEFSFWSIIDTLRKNNITMPGMFQLVRSYVDNKVEGVSRFCMADNLQGGVEIHLRRFQAADRSWMHANKLDLYESNSHVEIEGVRVKTLSHSDSILVFLYEVTTREVLLIRDCYDASLLFQDILIEPIKDHLKKRIVELGLIVSALKVYDALVSVGLAPPTFLSELKASNLVENPQGLDAAKYYERFFFSDLGFPKARWLLFMEALRGTMNKWVDNGKFERILKITDTRFFTKLFFNMRVPVFCVELFPKNSANTLAYKKRLIGEHNGLVYLMGVNNLLQDKDFDVLENL